MYHLLSGFYTYLTRKEQFSILILGLDAAGKTTLLEKIKSIYNDTPAVDPSRIGPTVGQNIGKITLPSSYLQFWDLGGQSEIRPIWSKYYDDCHAVCYVVDSCDEERLVECWEVFESVLTHPVSSLLPTLVLANKQDNPSALPVAEIKEFFNARIRERDRLAAEADAPSAGEDRIGDRRRRRESEDGVEARAGEKDKGKGKARAMDAEDDWDDDWEEDQGRASIGSGGRSSMSDGGGGGGGGGSKGRRRSREFGVGGQLHVMGVSALEGRGIREAVQWLYARVKNSPRK